MSNDELFFDHKKYHDDALYHLAFVQCKNKKYGEALATIETFLEEHSDNTQGKVLKEYILKKRNQTALIGAGVVAGALSVVGAAIAGIVAITRKK